MRLAREALRDLRAHRVRSILSAVSLFVGVVAIVAIFTVGSVVRDVLVARAEQLDGRAVTVEMRLGAGTLATRQLGGIEQSLRRRVTATGSVYALLDEVPAHVGSPAELRQSGQLQRPQTVTLVGGQLDQVRRLPVLQGRWPAPDRRVYPGGLVVNQAAAAQYGGVNTRLEVELGDVYRPYVQRIVGVVSDGTAMPKVYESLAGALSYQPAVLPPGDGLDLFVHDGKESEAVLREQMGEVATDLGVDQSEVEIQRSDTIARLVGSLHATQAAFLGIASVTLVVAVIGLLNIGFATVRERTRELTVRRAIGATRARVFGLVLLATVLLGLLSALVAVGLAFLGVVLVVPHLLNPASAVQAPSFPWSAGLAGFTAAVVAALLGGIAPALAATRVDMAYALRE